MPVDSVLRALILGSIVLGTLVSLLVLVGAFIQFQRDRQNAHRIERFMAWETALPAYLFREPGPSGSSAPSPAGTSRSSRPSWLATRPPWAGPRPPTSETST